MENVTYNSSQSHKSYGFCLMLKSLWRAQWVTWRHQCPISLHLSHLFPQNNKPLVSYTFTIQYSAQYCNYCSDIAQNIAMLYLILQYYQNILQLNLLKLCLWNSFLEEYKDMISGILELRLKLFWILNILNWIKLKSV